MRFLRPTLIILLSKMNIFNIALRLKSLPVQFLCFAAASQPKINRVIFLLLAVILCFNNEAVYAKGLKGNLEPNELKFTEHELVPILIKNGICIRADADCLNPYIICASHDTLACEVHGVSDRKAIKEIMSAVIASDLNISSFKIWKSKYHEESWFEKPLINYKNNIKAQ